MAEGSFDNHSTFNATRLGKWALVGVTSITILGQHSDSVAASAAASKVNADSKWEAGAASMVLEPPENSIMGGYGTYFPPITAKPRRASGTHDPLEVAALATRGIRGSILVFVGIDAIGLRNSTAGRIERVLLDWNSSIRLVTCASHSHATPDTFGLWGALPNRSGADPRYLEQIEHKTIATVKKAVDSLRPVTLNYSSADLPISIGQQNTTSKATWVWALDPRTNETIATWTHWNAHPTVLPTNNTLLSADFIGFYRHSLNDMLGTPATNVFCNGYLAGVYPVIEGERADPFGDQELSESAQDPLVAQSLRQASFLGHSLAEAALESQQSRAPMTDTSSFLDTFSTWLPVTNPLFHILIRMAMIEGDLVRGRLLVRSGWFKWGPIQGVALPGEPSAKVASWFTNTLAERGVEHPLVLGQAGGMTGYLLDPATEHGKEPFKYQSTVSPSPQGAVAYFERFKQIFWW